MTQSALDFSVHYPQSAGFKGTDTSRSAAESTDAATLRVLVVRCLDRHGSQTADEVATRLGIDKLAIRPRCSELRRLGQIVDTGERRINTSGKAAIVWRLT